MAPDVSGQEGESATVTTIPMQTPKCGAHCRTTGQPCKNFVVHNCRRCRMHGARAGAPTGSRNGAYKHGCHTKQARAASQWARDMARSIDVFGAVIMTAAGGKPHKKVRRKRHVKRALRALAAAKASKGEKSE
jgi:hypothetical protein